LAFKAVICRPSELGSAERQQWQAFQLAAGLDSPFLSGEYVAVIGELFPVTTRVAVVFDGQDLVGFLPFSQHRFGRASGFGDYLTGIQAFIPYAGPWSFKDVLRAASIDFFEFTHLVASQVPHTGTTLPTHPLWAADLSHGYDRYLAEVRQTGGGFVKTAQRKRLSVERNDPNLRFEFGQRDLALVRQLIDWKSAQVRQAGQWDMFTEQPGAREYVERLASADSPGMVGCVSSLRSGDRLLAVSIDVRSPTVLALENTAYDPAAAPLSPGRTCMLKVMEAAAGSGVLVYHLGMGEHEYKRRLATRFVNLVNCSVGRPSLGTRLARRRDAIRSRP
jgi:CelD/BcsL family acetyltransferase involved in cellulose biosynthesis